MVRIADTPTLSEFRVPPAEVRAACEVRLREAEASEAAARTRRRVADSGVPERYLGGTLAACHPGVARWAAAAAAGDLAGCDSPFLLLHGENGTGKTTQACAALLSLAPSMTIRFVDLPELFEEAMADGCRRAAEVIARCTVAGALVVDELGKEELNRKTAAWAFNIVQRRMKRRQPTVFVTNMDSAGLKRHFDACGDPTMGDSIVSRILAGHRVRFDGADRRIGGAP
ncbi:MAG: ATP-binding protein [Adlercreutzia sp.]|nr:ATP-binding protein [Adlercreutzia sp.]